jgi:TatD DNase family protein
MKDFNKDIEEVLDRALHAGVTRIIAVGIDIPSSLKALKLAEKYDFIYSTIGYHPHNANDSDFDGIEELCELAAQPKVVAWGEIGLDFYRLYSPREKQIEAFEQQLDMAIRFNLPVIIHDREAHREVFETLKKYENKKLNGVIHCFSGDYDLAMEFINMGYYISIPGTVTYKKARTVRDVAEKIPLERMLIETDAPFLAPVPKRGKRNEPSFVTYTAQAISSLRGIELEDFGRQTSENAKELFNLL